MSQSLQTQLGQAGGQEGWSSIVLPGVIVRDRPQVGHGLVNDRTRFLIMNELWGAMCCQVETGEWVLTFLVVMMDRISPGLITVIISHQPTHSSQPASQPSNQNQIRAAGEDKLYKWEMLVGDLLQSPVKGNYRK